MKQLLNPIAVPMWMFALLVLAVVVLAAMFWSVKRRRKPRLGHKADVANAIHPTVAGLVQQSIVAGNSVELIQNGAFFDRLFADLQAAKKTINLETFLSKHGEVTKKLTDILVAKRKENVEVRMLLDGSGGKNYGKADIKRLKKAGAAVYKFHPFTFGNVGRFNQRTHRKMVIIDGEIGYIGGHCLVDAWLGTAQDKKHFRDITARVTGPVLNQLQSAFTDNWIEETGEVMSGETFFPELSPTGPTDAHIVFISPVGGPSTVKLLHYIAITEAKKSITVQNPYFLPDPDARDALIEAVKRGVHVRIMIPATDATDAKFVSHASHHHYGTLLKGGVHVFEYNHTLLHQKVFTIDRKWSSIGSTNFDDRSFEINDEVSLVVYDEEIARQLEEIFDADAKLSTERNLDEWRKRPVLHKLKDGSAFLFNEQL